MGNEISSEGQKLNLWRQEAREGVNRIYRVRDEFPEIMAIAAGLSLKAGRTYYIGADTPRKPKPDAKKSAKRALVKARRKQKHGGKR